MKIATNYAPIEYREGFVVTFPDTGKCAQFFDDEPNNEQMAELRRQSRYADSIYARPCLIGDIEAIPNLDGVLIKVERRHWKLRPST